MTATETVLTDSEIAVTGTAATASLTGPDSPDAAAPGADPATDADGRVVAVWAALNAEPGGSATAIGAAAGLSRMAAGKILNDFEADGRARREPGVSEGGRGRAADRWFPIIPDAVTATATDVDAEPTGTADAPAMPPETPDAAPDAVPTPDGPEKAFPAGSASVDEPTDDEEQDSADDDADDHESDRTDSGLDAVAVADASEPVADDPAWVRARADLAELVNLFGGVMSAKAEGNAVMALGCLEMAMTKVASAHRNARAALTGTAAPARPVSAARPGASGGTGAGDAVRPGALRDLVYAHLAEFPDKDFTPYEIGKVINRSSGAVANALDRLVSLGEAVLTCERPRRFGLAPTAKSTPAAPADAHDTDADAA
ncbi:hypothetical protein [Nonomuraea sp. NPDC001699]